MSPEKRLLRRLRRSDVKPPLKWMSKSPRLTLVLSTVTVGCLLLAPSVTATDADAPEVLMSALPLPFGRCGQIFSVGRDATRSPRCAARFGKDRGKTERQKKAETSGRTLVVIVCGAFDGQTANNELRRAGLKLRRPFT